MNTPKNTLEDTGRTNGRKSPQSVDDVDVSDIDEKSARYLQILDENDGSATTTELRERAGFSKSAVHYRHDKLSDLGLVVVDRPEEKYDGKSAVTSSLTELGKRLVDGEMIPTGKAGASLERLERRVEGLRGAMRSNRSELDARLDDVENVTNELVDFADETLREELEVHRAAISHLLDRLDELEADVDEKK